jgi:formylglycine-generating enzyme required for sulfatase activity
METHKRGVVLWARAALQLWLVAIGCLALSLAGYAQDTEYSPKDSLFSLPYCADENWERHDQCSQGEIDAWRKDLMNWRDQTRDRVGYDDALYKRPEGLWAQSSFMQAQMMVEDRYFYDPVEQGYTVDRYLDDLEKRFGGIDSVLIWPSYPNIGIDNRNQFDLLRAMPGGVAAVRAMVQQFHKRGVHVLFPYNPWDRGTRPEGVPDAEAIATLMKEINADGVNGDTMDGMAQSFFQASDKVGHPLVFEPEGFPSSAEMFKYDTMNWGYWRYPFTPLVSEGKLIEPRHMTNISDRWNRSKTDDLQFAFFNGVGVMTWENVWSIWNGLSPRDDESVRRVASVERAAAPFLVSQDWEPLTPTIQFGVFASSWQLKGETVLTVVNRNEYDLTGPQIELPYKQGLHYYDLWHGVELTPVRKGEKVTLGFDMEAHGYGALLVTPELKNEPLKALMEKSKSWAAMPLASLSDAWKPLDQKVVEIAKTPLASSEPKGMVKVPAGEFEFRVVGTEIEGFNWEGLDVQYPWENSPRRHHTHMLRMDSFWMDRHPVTNAEFKQFLDATRYHPKDDFNFLKDWKDGSYPAGWEKKPVTWVSLEDARAYAAWAGKRLPHEWEWQYAAQGSDGRTYPWGGEWNDAAVPVPDKGRELSPPDAVDAHPLGASPFGVMDMVGNVWQWTDEYVDDHTRTAVVRGGSLYQPQGSWWYFPQAYKNTEHSKYLLMSPSEDRAGTVGFRCVMDAQQ